MSSDGNNETSFDSLKRKLKQIRTELAEEGRESTEINGIIDKALNAPMLSIEEETRLYVSLDGPNVDEARTKLVDAHFPMVVVAAWEDFRFFAIPLEKMVEAGRRALEQGTITFRYPTSPLKTFHSHVHDDIAEFLLKELDEYGLEPVNLEEVKELAKGGRKAELDAILAPLNHIEKEVIKRHFTKTIWSEQGTEEVVGMAAFFDKVEAIALRKLRREKKH